ncbi:MAG: hypothetical protein ABIK65_05540 [Candidatus Eisenbacteria bacterium]
MGESGTPVGGPIALDHKNGKAYVANLSSDDVTVDVSHVAGRGVGPAEGGMRGRT